MDWSNVRYFSKSEFVCRCDDCGGEEHMDPHFITLMDELRERVGRPIRINSGFRCANHTEERVKSTPGSHSVGLAADIAVSNGAERYEILRHAFDLGMVGIGVADSFVHVDYGHPHAIRPALWKYG